MWRDQELTARGDNIDSYTPADAQRFAQTLGTRLAVGIQGVSPVFLEDPLHYLQRERQLPINVDPIENRLADAGERERIRQDFERGLDRTVGYVLPLQRASGKNGPEWQSR